MTRLNRRTNRKKILSERCLVMYSMNRNYDADDYRFLCEYEKGVLQLHYGKIGKMAIPEKGDDIALFLPDKESGLVTHFAFVVSNVVKIVVDPSMGPYLSRSAATGFDVEVVPVDNTFDSKPTPSTKGTVLPFRSK